MLDFASVAFTLKSESLTVSEAIVLLSSAESLENSSFELMSCCIFEAVS